jgi:hypothetical protein
MVTVAHDVFGTVEVPDGDDVWETEVEWAEGTVEVMLVVDDVDLDVVVLDGVAGYVTDLAGFDRRAWAAMRAGLGEEDSAVDLYVDHHQDEPGSPGEFLSRLRLVRVGLHPGSRPEAVFDYTIGAELTQYVIAVGFDRDGSVAVTMES